MAAKPTEVVSWATDPGAAIDDPGAGVKAAGFSPDAKTPAHWFNWLMNLIGGWIAYLSDGAFTGGISVAGGLASDTVTSSGKSSGTGTATEPGLAAIPASSGAASQRAALYVGPQKSALAAVAKGDVAMLVPSVTTPGDAKLAAQASATQLDRYVPNVKTPVNAITVVGAGEQLLHTIPANSLRSGSMIEAMLSARDTVKGTGTPSSTLALRLKDALGVTFDFAVTPTWVLAGGGTAKLVLHGWCTIDGDPANNRNAYGGGIGLVDATSKATAGMTGSNIDTTQDVGIYIISAGAASDSQFEIDGFVIRAT